MVQYSVKHLLRFVTLVCLAIVALLLLKKAFDDVMIGDPKIGVLESQNDWPRHLKNLVRDAKEDRLNLTNVKLHHIDYSYYFLKCSGNEALLAWLQNRLVLEHVDSNHERVKRFRFLLDQVPGPAPIMRSTRFYVSQNWLTGEEDDLYLVAYDEDREEFIIEYYFNF